MTEKEKTIRCFTVFLLSCFLLSVPQSWAQSGPVIIVDQRVHDFGSIQEKGGEVVHTFIVKNTGNAPLTIHQVIASCGCTTPRWPQEPVGAGQTGNIQVAFNPAGQPGAFEKTVHIYSDGSPEPYMLTIKGIVSSEPEGEPVFIVDNPVHDFGLINEEDIDAIHVFRVKNTGTAPLIITHVQSSCGCTEPDWTKDPIPPGGTGDVVITYVAKNRPGPFSKNVMVYTNEKRFRQRLTVKGDVIPIERNLARSLADTLGIIQIERKLFTFTVQPDQILTQNVWIRNYTEEDATLSLGNIPPYLAIEVPEQLKSGKARRFNISVDGSKANNMRGRAVHRLEWKTVTASGKTSVETLPVFINFVDGFSKMTPTERQDGPVMQIPETTLDFGKIKKSRGFLGLGGRKSVSRRATITNTGKSPLILHSISCDDPRLRIEIDRKTLQPEESATLTVSLDPGDIQSVGVDIIIVSNDSHEPVREIRIYAERDK